MSTPEQPGEPQLTRKRLREIRMTGSTPIIGPDTVLPAPSDAPAESVKSEGDSEPAAVAINVGSVRPTPMPVSSIPGSMSVA